MLARSDVDELTARLGDRLLAVRAPLADRARATPAGSDTASHAASDTASDAASDAASDPAGRAADLARLRNPFAIEDDPGAFHTTGWFGAFESAASPWAVAAESTADIAAAVDVARRRGLRVVVKGTGHDYLGRSSGPGSLLVWTHRMRQVTPHDAFTPAGGSGPGVPAVSVEAGTRWLEVYQVAAGIGRYVQGGGCTTVGAAGGFTQGGGFGSFSRRFGTAAGNALEFEVVTASGEILVVSAFQHADLFWALRGGGGGTFGIVSRVTFRTHPLPATIGWVAGTVRARDDRAFHRLVETLVRFIPNICDATWGEQIRLNRDNSLTLLGLGLDVNEEEARRAWEPLLGWVGDHPASFDADVSVAVAPFGFLYSGDTLDAFAPTLICHDDRPEARPGHFWWASNQGEVSQYLHAYRSRWLPVRCFVESPDALADALVEASRHWGFSLHLNKGLSGAAPDAVARDRTTAINPAVFDAAALVITASGQQYAYPGVPGHEPDLVRAAERARRVADAMGPIERIAPHAGSYVNETDYFEPDWQASFWGSNYERLLEVKRAYDPMNVFQVHHGVGSEAQPP